ncbi:MAG: hypothetical protein FWE03_04595 [Firmicutes bacterium]|nr:hypothetical protein [Bacillota bacterium]
MQESQSSATSRRLLKKMEYNKLIIKDVEIEHFNNFIKELKKNRTLKIKSYKPATDKVLQERFTFSCEFDNISIVYETRAKCIIITAADYLLSLLNADFLRVKENRTSYIIAPTMPKPALVKPASARTPISNQHKNTVIQPKPALQKAVLTETTSNNRLKNTSVKPAQSVHSSSILAKSKPISTQKKPVTITNSQSTSTKNNPSQKTKKAIEMEKKLKKLLPTAFELLCEQSKTDFIIGMTDITNDYVRLSDYSMLLVPLYRALERLIFDLQQAENINVKMIGQGYEKDDAGRYILKAGYQKRIGSIVYGEVMAALYTEYFEKRNFYAHSDITGDSLSRVITDKAMVKNILTSLIVLIEYNAKKLKEIGFSLGQKK